MDVGRGRPFRLVERNEELRVGLELDLLRPFGAQAGPAANDIAGDREEPGARRLRVIAAPHRTEGVQECGLRDVFCLVGIAHVAEHGAVYRAPVCPVDSLEGAIGIHECFMPRNLASQAC